MTEEAAIAFYVQSVAETARTMSLTDAIGFLRGGLCLAGDHEAVRGLRTAYQLLVSNDAQLQLIASGQLEQMRLALGDPGESKPNGDANGGPTPTAPSNGGGAQ